MKILIAEDYQPNQKIISRIMERWVWTPLSYQMDLELLNMLKMKSMIFFDN